MRERDDAIALLTKCPHVTVCRHRKVYEERRGSSWRVGVEESCLSVERRCIWNVVSGTTLYLFQPSNRERGIGSTAFHL